MKTRLSTHVGGALGQQAYESTLQRLWSCKLTVGPCIRRCLTQLFLLACFGHLTSLGLL